MRSNALFALLVSCLLTSLGLSQVATQYHAWIPTDGGDPLLTKWDIKPDRKTRWYVVEQVDSKGRVLDLKFMENNHVYDGGEAGCVYHVSYAYRKNQVVEICYEGNDSLYGGFETGTPALRTYTLDSSGFIAKVISKVYVPRKAYEFYRKEFSEQDIRARIADSERRFNNSAKFIWHYVYSKAKLTGRMPTVRGYDYRSDTRWLCPADTLLKGH